MQIRRMAGKRRRRERVVKGCRQRPAAVSAVVVRRGMVWASGL